MRQTEARRDLYRRLAKEQGYKSRAAFKLIEANERYGFIREGGKVLDLGSAPGGWLQVASELVGPTGAVVGVDISPIRLKGRNIFSVRMDVNDPGFAEKALELLGGPADVVLSDLAPTVSGVWELDQRRQADLTLRAFELSLSILKPGGSVFCKLFEGETSQEVRGRMKRMFSSVRVIKPAASRRESSELYYCCEGLKAQA